jgi:hypothetical protein
MIDYDPGTNTLTWNNGEEVVLVFEKLNVGTVLFPAVQLYKGSSNVTSTYTTGAASVTNDGSTMIFTTPKFLNSLPPNRYKLHLQGTVDSLAKDLHTMDVVVLKRGN